MTFLTVYTPTYRRPGLLEQCRESIAAQTVPVDHVIVEDTVGIGTYPMIQNHVDQIAGDYVMVLSDDNILTDDAFAADLETVCEEQHWPDVVVFRGEVGGNIQPVAWGGEPREGAIDLSCFAVRRGPWKSHKDAWVSTDDPLRREGDYDFIHTLWEVGYRFFWWDRLVFRALRISWGQPE